MPLGHASKIELGVDSWLRGKHDHMQRSFKPAHLPRHIYALEAFLDLNAMPKEFVVETLEELMIILTTL